MVKICWQSSVGGIDNPLSARAMYLGSSLYRIHGSNEPETIGQAVSSEPDSELYVARLSFGPASRLSMMHIIASLA